MPDSWSCRSEVELALGCVLCVHIYREKVKCASRVPKAQAREEGNMAASQSRVLSVHECSWHCAFGSRFGSFHLLLSVHLSNENTEEHAIGQVMVQKKTRV